MGLSSNATNDTSGVSRQIDKITSGSGWQTLTFSCNGNRLNFETANQGDRQIISLSNLNYDDTNPWVYQPWETCSPKEICGTNDGDEYLQPSQTSTFNTSGFKLTSKSGYSDFRKDYCYTISCTGTSSTSCREAPASMRQYYCKDGELNFVEKGETCP
jgi:hypothetical protein